MAAGRAGYGSPMRAGIVFNPVKLSRDELAPQVETAQPLEWSEPAWFETAPDDGGAAAVRAALDAGVDLLIVAGGDGTVRIAADLITGTDVPLAIVPAGTGNLLARNLGIDVGRLRAAMSKRPCTSQWTPVRRRPRRGAASLAASWASARCE